MKGGAVGPGDTDRRHPHRVQLPDERLIHLAREDHLRDPHRLLVRDPQALAELGLEIQGREHPGELLAAAVHERHGGLTGEQAGQVFECPARERPAPDLYDHRLRPELHVL